MDPAEWGQKWASYESGTGTASLTFAHAVVEPNLSRQGVAVLADSLEPDGGTITSAASGTAAVLAHSGLGHDPAHKVDWQQAPADSSQEGPNRAPTVNAEAAAFGQFTGVNNAPRGVLVSKPFYEVFSDPDGDELSYTAEITSGDAALVDELEVTLDAVVRRPGQKWPPVGAFDRVWFKAEADSDWKAKNPVPAHRPLVTVTLTATDPDGLSASVSGVFKIWWETYPEVVAAVAAAQAITLTYDTAVLDDPAPTPRQFTVHVRDADGTTSTVEVAAVSVSGAVVTLALAEELTAGHTVTVGYAHAHRTPVRQADGGGDPAPRFAGQALWTCPPSNHPARQTSTSPPRPADSRCWPAGTKWQARPPTSCAGGWTAPNSTQHTPPPSPAPPTSWTCPRSAAGKYTCRPAMVPAADPRPPGRPMWCGLPS